LKRDDSSPDSNSVLYAILSCLGVKRTLVDAYAAYAENMSFEMAQKLRCITPMELMRSWGDNLKKKVTHVIT